MDFKLSDAELIIMQILWAEGETRATRIADIAKVKYGWEKNTGYTFLHRLIKKGAVRRSDPGFYCRAACDRETLLGQEARDMVDKLYNGSIGQFVTAFFKDEAIPPEEKEQLQKLINDYK